MTDMFRLLPHILRSVEGQVYIQSRVKVILHAITECTKLLFYESTTSIVSYHVTIATYLISKCKNEKKRSYVKDCRNQAN